MPTVTLLAATLDAVLARSTSAGSPLHGEAHWRRVATLGLYLAERDPRTDPLVVTLFGLFHDSMRRNDGWDPGHGKRGGSLARRLLDGHAGDSAATMRTIASAIAITTLAQLDLLVAACNEHTDGHTTVDATIGACWDADRLDLVRLAIVPNPLRLSTVRARAPQATEFARAQLGRPLEWPDVFAEAERLVGSSR